MVLTEALEQRQLLSTVPSGFVDAKLTGGIAQGTAMAVAPDGRIFVAQQAGKLSIVKNNKLLSTPFVKVSTPNNASEGLIGVAIDPKFSTNHYVYISYTKTSPLRTVIVRYTANGDVAISSSAKTIFTTTTLQNHEHNGGALAFGSDGKLYVALGDDLTITNAQSMKTTQGKILRINSDGSIPTDNPFYKTNTGNNRAVWAYGFRNPFTLSFQPGTGRLFSGDVGSDFWEEVNDIKKGGNYGWSNSEGPNVNPGEIAGIYSYAHNGTSAAIIAGPFYNPSTVSFPSSYIGDFFMADYARGWIKTLDTKTLAVSNFVSGLDRCVAMALAKDGSLYYMLRGGANGSGEIHRVSYSVSAKPSIIDQPDSQKIAIGQPVTFDIGASGTTPLSYQWKRNGVSISGANGPSYTINSAGTKDNGASFTCVVTNKLGSATSSAAKLTVINDKPPVPVITLPDPKMLYNAGDTIKFAGSATDAEDGKLSASHFTWSALLHHDTHTHPFYGPVSGITSGSLDIPQVEETSSSVYYQLFLTVTDSAGVSVTVEQDILPHKIDFTVQSGVPGLNVAVDSVTFTDNTTITGVTGIRRQLSAPLIQVLDGNVYQFDSWSDGGDATHFISTPGADTTYTANYTLIGTVPVGDGLNAKYYDNSDFTGKSSSRSDPQINFIWSLDPPITGFGADSFSVRWTGYIVVPTSENYTFYANADDGVKVTIDNSVLIDKFSSTGLHEYSGTTQSPLVAGQQYPITVEYKDVSGFAQAQFSFASAMLPKQLVPQSALFTTQIQPPPPPPTTIQVNASADTYVRSGLPDNNYGSDDQFLVKNDDIGDNSREAYLRFDLTGITSIKTAELDLVGMINDADNVQVGVYGSTDTPDWDETTLTWNTKFESDPIPITSFTVTTSNDATYSADLTAYLQAELAAGHTQVTLILKGVSPTVSNAIFHSHEASSGAPKLVITPDDVSP